MPHFYRKETPRTRAGEGRMVHEQAFAVKGNRAIRVEAGAIASVRSSVKADGPPGPRRAGRVGPVPA